MWKGYIYIYICNNIYTYFTQSVIICKLDKGPAIGFETRAVSLGAGPKGDTDNGMIEPLYFSVVIQPRIMSKLVINFQVIDPKTVFLGYDNYGLNLSWVTTSEWSEKLTY